MSNELSGWDTVCTFAELDARNRWRCGLTGKFIDFKHSYPTKFKCWRSSGNIVEKK
jgi:hypothetical protein